MHMACRFCILTPKIGMAWMALNNQAGEQLLLITATTVHRRSYRAALLHDKKKRPALLQQGSWLGILVLWLIIPQSMGNFQIRCTRASSAPPLSPQGTQSGCSSPSSAKHSWPPATGIGASLQGTTSTMSLLSWNCRGAGGSLCSPRGSVVHQIGMRKMGRTNVYAW